MRKLFIAVVALVAPMMFVGPSGASSSGWGTITGVIVNYAGGVFFTQSSTVTSQMPDCAKATSAWAINGSTPGGQALVSLLMTAYAGHKTVAIVGTGDCSLTGDRENVLYINAMP